MHTLLMETMELYLTEKFISCSNEIIKIRFDSQKISFATCQTHADAQDSSTKLTVKVNSV